MPAGKDGLMTLETDELDRRMPARDVLKKRMQLHDLRRGEQISSSGMTGYTGIASGKTPFGTRPVRYIVLMRDKTAWIFAGTAQDKRRRLRHE